jgi:hypothetical protein
VGTTASHVIELVKSLPPEDQRTICAELARHANGLGSLRRRSLKRLPDGTYHNADGIPNDHPFFKIMEEIEEERHRTLGPPAPELD